MLQISFARGTRSPLRAVALLVVAIAGWAAGPLAVAAALPGAAGAVLIARGDGEGNTDLPDPDPGVANVGRRFRGGRSAVYLGDRWVLTARHVGEGDLLFGRDRFRAIPGSQIDFYNPDGSAVDLVLFQLETAPDLPPLRISREAPRPGTPVWLAGYGFSRGRALEWRRSPADPPIGGWRWRGRTLRRWGTNLVEGVGESIVIGDTRTRAIATLFTDPFDPWATESEASAAVGDSGGALFVQTERGFELAGILFAVTNHEDQPARTTLFGNLTLAVDLAYYRDQIVEITRAPPIGPVPAPGRPPLARASPREMPAPWACGLGFEWGLVLGPWAALRQRRRRSRAMTGS